MNVNNLTAKELAGYVYIKGAQTDVETAMQRRLQECVDQLMDQRDLLEGMRAEIRQWKERAEQAELGHGS